MGRKKHLPVEFENSNIILVAKDRDRNGNAVVRLKYPNSRKFSYQTNGNLPKTHKALQGVSRVDQLTGEEVKAIEKELIEWIKEYGTKTQKKGLVTGTQKMSKGGSTKNVILTNKERERLDYLQSREDVDILTESENEEYEKLVKKYRKTKDYKGDNTKSGKIKKGDTVRYKNAKYTAKVISVDYKSAVPEAKIKWEDTGNEEVAAIDDLEKVMAKGGSTYEGGVDIALKDWENSMNKRKDIEFLRIEKKQILPNGKIMVHYAYNPTDDIYATTKIATETISLKDGGSTYAGGGEITTRSGKVLKTDIIHEKKSLGLPYQIVYSKFLRENGISKSSLSFAESSELETIMLNEWEKSGSTYERGGEILMSKAHPARENIQIQLIEDDFDGYEIIMYDTGQDKAIMSSGYYTELSPAKKHYNELGKETYEEGGSVKSKHKLFTGLLDFLNI